jgi:hypothetical protein
LSSSDRHYYSSYYSTPTEPITPELSPRHILLSPKHQEEPNHLRITTNYLSDSHSIKHHSKKSSKNNKAIHTLQMEVAALCEEIDQLRRNDIAKSKSMFKWRWLWLFKSIAKHAFFNFLILMMLFIVLWRRKSPIAYAVISYAGPRLKELMSYIFSRLVFWKVTV